MAAPAQHSASGMGPSNAKQWIMCPPSIRMSDGIPDSGSPYAAAGTLAHAIGELKARKYFLEPMSTRTYNTALRKCKKDPAYDPGMEDATDAYLDYLKELAMRFATPPLVALETRMDLSTYIPEGIGTADAILIGEGRLCVCDYKNGAGVPVDAVGNPQMMLYALGALEMYAPIYGDSIRDIHLAIIQPHAGGVKEWDTTREELLQWGENVVKPAAAAAYAGEGECNPSTDPNGWCRFCRAKSKCAARAKALLTLEEYISHPPKLLTDDQIGLVLSRALAVEAWAKDLKEYALSAALSGRTITGYKVVAGRGSRDWADLDKAFQTLQARGVPEAMLWERNPVTVAKLEKALGKKPFAEAAEGLVDKKPGKPALVPESDPRKPYNAAETAFQAVSTDG